MAIAIWIAQGDRKGDLQNIYANGQSFPPDYDPPKFVRTVILNTFIADLEQYKVSYDRKVQIDQVSHDVETDCYRFKVHVTNLNSTKKGAITKKDCDPLFEKWGAVFVSEAENEVIFDLKITSAMWAKELWQNRDLTGVVAEAISVENGVYTIQADYTDSGMSETGAERLAASVSNELVSHENRVITFKIDSRIINARIISQFQQELDTMIDNARYYLPDFYIDLLATKAHGEETWTLSEFQTRIKDKLTDPK